MRTLPILICAAAVAVPSLAAAAAPAPAAANRDVRCLMLSNMFNKTAAVAQAKEAAGQARLFYLGRVSDKYTPARLETAMAAEAKAIDLGHAGPDMNKCLASVQAAAEAVETAGRKAAGTTPAAAAANASAPAGPAVPGPSR